MGATLGCTPEEVRTRHVGGTGVFEYGTQRRCNDVERGR
jgi:hypothetical protein